MIEKDDEYNFNKLIGITYDKQNIDFSKLKNGLIKLQKVSSFKSEEDICNGLKNFYCSNSPLYILEVQFLFESIHLRLLIHLIERFEAESKNC